MEGLGELRAAVRKRNVILFVGSGISATLGLPTWQDLVGHMAGELGYDQRLFHAYESSQALAEYYEIEKGGIGTLARWMQENWSDFDRQIAASPIYQGIVELDFPIIYTTNYDRCLERAFELRSKPYRKLVKVADLLGADPYVTQIVKFHGDMGEPETMVLSESSYFSRFDFESPLDIKLRSDMLGKSILFVGYSLSDVNLRYLIYKLDQIWKRGEDAEKRPPSYICLPAPNPIQEAVFRRRGVRVLVGDSLDKSKNIETLFAALR